MTIGTTARFLLCMTLGSALAGCASRTSPSVSQNVAADKQLARSANLVLSDLPAGWTSKPHSSSSGNAALDAQLSSCLHTNLDLFKGDDRAEVHSPEFDDTNGDSVSSDVDYLADTTQADVRMKVLQQSNFSSCLAAAAQSLVTNGAQTGSTLPAGTSLGAVTVAPMSFPALGDQSAAFRVTIPITYRGIVISAYFDLVGVQKGRVLVGMDFDGVNAPLGSPLEEQLTQTVVKRLRNT